MNEAVDRLILERQRLDAGLPAWVLVSLSAHLFLAAVAVLAPLLLPKGPVLRVQDGFAVAVLPRGGGGAPQVKAPPAPTKPAAEPAPAPPPKVLKPPVEAPRPDALPEPDARRRAPRRQQPQAQAPPAEPKASATPGTGAAAATPGVAVGPSGPGVPNGTDTGGDWYLAGVTQKIWLIWNQQIKTGFTHPVGVSFTILADGSVEDVHVSQPSGAALLDMAAQRAVLNAAPFGPLPREYGTNRKPIQAIFSPTD